MDATRLVQAIEDIYRFDREVGAVIEVSGGDCVLVTVRFLFDGVVDDQ